MKKIYTLLIFLCTFSELFSQGWVSQTSGWDDTFISVSFIDENYGYVTGWDTPAQESVIFKTTNGGIEWTLIYTFPFGFISRDVLFIDINNGWVVGSGGRIFKTTDGGISWNYQTSGVASFLDGIFFWDTNNGWAVGGNGTIISTTNGGTNWITQSSGTQVGLRDVTFYDLYTGIIVGLNTGYEGIILKTNDGGNSWTPQSSGVANYLESVAFSSEYNIIAVGNGGIIIITTNGGSSWNIQSSGTTESLNSISFPSTNYGWIVGSSGTILNTTNTGTSWSPQNSGVTDRLFGSSFIDVNNGWAVGEGGTILKNSNTLPSIILNSPNGGENWTEGSSHNITWTSSNITNVKIEYTTNNGTSWINIISSTPASTGSYSWTVPNTPSTQCKVRISDATNSSIYDISNDVFTISSQPSPVEFIPHTITTSADAARSVYAVDVDGDGDMDVLSASSGDDKIAWYENDGNENFTSHTITTEASSARSVFAVDVDGDEDMDVLSASWGDEIVWYENDGNENFTPHTITANADGAASVYAVDVDGDGDMDVLSASSYDDKIAWYENDGNENFTSHTITTDADYAESVYAVDVDGDGNMDVLSASSYDDKIAWYENDGNENFTPHTITANADGATSVYAIDVDGDGDMDVLSASETDNKIAWYENDGNENFTSHTITTNAVLAFSVYAVNVDGDGDIDVLSASRGDDKIAWYENDGNENFTSYTITDSAFGTRSVYAIDVDSDGNMDVLSASGTDNKIAWYENKSIIPTIVVTSPNGGEEWIVGEQQDITWNSQDVANVRIGYTTDYGSTWTNIISSTPSDGSYSWTVPNTPSTLCIVGISDASDSSIYDISDNVFTISGAPTVTVTSPNGGENWQIGTIEEITWESSNVANVKIDYTTNNGTNWTYILVSTPSDGSHSWTVPNTPSTSCKVRISDASNASINDISNNVFTISSQASSITVTSPIEGDNWIIGSEQVVTWSSNNVTGSLNIWLSIDGGATFLIPISLITDNDGIDTVTVPIFPSTNCRIKIESIDNLSVYGLNPGDFIIRDEAPIIFVYPTSLSFGEVMLGDSSAQNLIVKNNGELDLNISNVSTSNNVFSAIPSSFIVSPGDSQTVVVKFIPTDTVSYSEELVITNNAGSGSDTISLSGDGIYLSFSLIDLSTTSLDFGNLLINSTTQQIFTVYNDASATINLEVTNITTGNNAYNITPTSFSIAPGNSQVVTVTFIPTEGINYNETLTIDHNSDGDQSFISLVGSGFVYPTTITLNNTVTFGPTSNIVNYRIIGLSGEVDIPVIDGLTGEHPYDWNVYWDDGDQDNYQVQYNGTSTFNFTPGKSFWILSEQPFTISDQVNSVQIDSIYTYSIPLHNGWNLISNPFDRSVSWAEVQTVNGLVQNQILYAWNGSWSNPITMTPYEGYYFNNSGNLPTLKIPYDPNGSLGKVLAKSQQLINTDEYLKFSLSYENKIKSEIFIGIDENSSNGFDEYDYFAAPGDFESVKISLVNKNLPKREKHLFIEQRPEIDEGQVFDVEIKAIPNKRLKLTTEGIENFDDYEIYLLEERLGQLYNLKEKSDITISPLHQYNNYKVLIGNSEFINSIKANLIPKEYVLHQNYPNPFNPRTIIRFSLPKKNSITLNVYSILGELVETLINNQDYEIGNYEIEFDAGRLASGVYLYRIAAGEFVQTKKMVLMK